MAISVIAVEGLVKHFGSVSALNGIDIDVRATTVLGLLGPNGAGKTTIVRILATILELCCAYSPELGIIEMSLRRFP
jgi:oleandomycin transport system ATP-binding protein